MATPTPVRVWIDPSCPWAWQAHVWLRDLRDHGVVELTHECFSLELNAAPGLPFGEAAPRYGPALLAMAQAGREGGQPALERFYVALGELRHDQKHEMSSQLLRDAAVEAGLGDLPDRADAATDLEDDIIAAYHDARRQDVFGVPSLRIDGDKTLYGPILAVGPTGDQGLALWDEVRRLSARPGFFELKRWPRDLRPGGERVGP